MLRHNTAVSSVNLQIQKVLVHVTPQRKRSPGVDLHSSWVDHTGMHTRPKTTN